MIQPRLREPGEHFLDSARTVLDLMSSICQSQEVDLFVLPELCPVGYSEDSFAKYLPRTSHIQQMYCELDRLFQRKARELNCFVSYGTIGWQKSDDSGLRFFIRQIAVDPNGEEVSLYDKQFLCDYGDCAETRFFSTGKRGRASQVFTVNGLRFGTIICADMRYPLLTRHLVKNEGADVILQPAAFSRDVSFRTWKSFRETRAVENGVYFIGVNYSGDEYGESSITPPWVDEKHEPVSLDTSDSYLLGVLKREVLDHTRLVMPFHRDVVKGIEKQWCS